ncbi:hypothetical protein P7M41_27025, partial [Vibrio parahaemolyticus]|nr:hypothetical protein [Vibrio parahaemolyticus]
PAFSVSLQLFLSKTGKKGQINKYDLMLCQSCLHTDFSQTFSTSSTLTWNTQFSAKIIAGNATNLLQKNTWFWWHNHDWKCKQTTAFTSTIPCGH